MMTPTSSVGHRAAEIGDDASNEPKLGDGQKLAEPKAAASQDRQKDPAGEDRVQNAKKRNPQ
jgi:hypothetical protein